LGKNHVKEQAQGKNCLADTKRRKKGRWNGVTKKNTGGILSVKHRTGHRGIGKVIEFFAENPPRAEEVKAQKGLRKKKGVRNQDERRERNKRLTHRWLLRGMGEAKKETEAQFKETKNRLKSRDDFPPPGKNSSTQEGIFQNGCKRGTSKGSQQNEGFSSGRGGWSPSFKEIGEEAQKKNCKIPWKNRRLMGNQKGLVARAKKTAMAKSTRARGEVGQQKKKKIRRGPLPTDVPTAGGARSQGGANKQ